MLFNRTSLYKFLTFSAMAVLTACSANTSQNTVTPSAPKNAANVDPQKFGAVYNGRTYQQAILTPVTRVENQSAVINQGDFLTQLSNVNTYSSKLSNSFAPTYEKPRRDRRSSRAGRPRAPSRRGAPRR